MHANTTCCPLDENSHLVSQGELAASVLHVENDESSLI